MPWQAPTICPADHRPYRGERCPVCVRERQAAYDKTRPSAAGRLYDVEWQRESRAFLAVHRVCIDCGEPATCVDHIVPHRGDPGLFRDRSNWAPRCVACNSRKCVAAEGGFGNRRTG